MDLAKTPVRCSSFRERHGEYPLHVPLELRHLVGEPLPSASQIPKLHEIDGEWVILQGFFSHHEELGNGEGSLLVRLRFSQRKLCKVRNEQRIDNDNPIALCGKIGEEGNVIAGGGLEAEEQGMALP